MLGLSNKLIYNAKPIGVAARSYRNSIQPLGASQSFSNGSVVQINIDCGRPNTFLDQQSSYCQTIFNYTGLSGTLTPSGPLGWGLVEQLKTLHASNVIDDFGEHRTAVNILGDVQINPSERVTQGSLSFGAAQFSFPTQLTTSVVITNVTTMDFSAPHEGTTVNAFTSNGVLSIGNSTLGSANVSVNLSGGFQRLGTQLALGESKVVVVPILSCATSSLCDKMLPIGEMIGGDLQLQLTLTKNYADIGVFSLSGGISSAWTCSYWLFQAQYVEIDPVAMAQIREASGGVYQIHTHRYSNFTGVITAGATKSNILIGARYASLESLLFVHRNQSLKNLYSVHWLNNFDKAGIQSYQIRLGTLMIPQQAVNCSGGTEALIELNKAFHNINNVSMPGMLNLLNYNTMTAATTSNFTQVGLSNIFVTSDLTGANATDNRTGAFIIGQELESYPNQSDVVSAGINTYNFNIFYEPTQSASTGYSYDVDCFAYYSATLQIANGIMMCVY